VVLPSADFVVSACFVSSFEPSEEPAGVSFAPPAQPARLVTTIAQASARLSVLFFIVFPPDLN